MCGNASSSRRSSHRFWCGGRGTKVPQPGRPFTPSVSAFLACRRAHLPPPRPEGAPGTRARPRHRRTRSPRHCLRGIGKLVSGQASQSADRNMADGRRVRLSVEHCELVLQSSRAVRALSVLVVPRATVLHQDQVGTRCTEASTCVLNALIVKLGFCHGHIAEARVVHRYNVTVLATSSGRRAEHHVHRADCAP